MPELHPLFAQILKPWAPPTGSITNYYSEGYDKDDAPCGYRSGDCCAMGTGCLSCGNTPGVEA
jgi:hypothetical protein